MQLEPAAWRALQAALHDLGHPAMLRHEELGLGELDNQLAPAAEGSEGKR